MILSLRHPIKRISQTITMFRFGQDKLQTKVETRSFNKSYVRDFTKIAYESEEKLSFVNGKCLIYEYNRTIIDAILEAGLYYLPMIGIGYLIYTNPCRKCSYLVANIFPVAVPLLGIAELAILKLWMNKIKRNHFIVGKIYLLENGETTQIWYANKNRRRLFGDELKKIYYNSVFVDPNYQQEEIIMFDKDKKIFPHTIKSVEGEGSRGYWLKYFSNGQNRLVIAKNPKFMNLKVLIELFKGKIIRSKDS